MSTRKEPSCEDKDNLLSPRRNPEEAAHDGGILGVAFLAAGEGYTDGNPRNAVRAEPLLPRPILDPNRGAQKPESFPNPILQKSLIGEVQLHRAIRKQDKRRWRD